MPRTRPALVVLGCLIAGRVVAAQSPATPEAFVVAVDEGGTLTTSAPPRR